MAAIKKVFSVLKQSSDSNPETESQRLIIAIASAQAKGDPFAHHWYLKPNGTQVCHKCGDTALAATDTIKNTKCSVNSHAFTN